MQRWDTGVDVEKGKEPQKKAQRNLASAVFSISCNFILNGDMFGILDNISEFVQKSIMSSWHYRTYKNVSLMEQKKEA